MKKLLSLLLAALTCFGVLAFSSCSAPDPENDWENIQKDGKLIRCKFTKKCKEDIKIPEYDIATFTIAVKPENVAFEKNTIYPTIWVKKVENVIDAEFKENTLADWKEEDLPF